MLTTFGPVEDNVLEQMSRCLDVEEEAIGVLCADNHLGYSMPLGGVVAYKNLISPSAVGFDIGCGNMAVKTDIRMGDLKVAHVMDDIFKHISFGMGRHNNERVEHSVLDGIAESPLPFQRSLVDLAAAQLGTVGSGNHYVDLFIGTDGFIWVGVHFGSRGFGHKTASWALAAAGAKDQSMMAPPVTFNVGTDLGQQYIEGMRLAGIYAQVGREWVVARVLRILGAQATLTVHNHHNFAWVEETAWGVMWVHRKGATPAYPKQLGFVGANMRDRAVILQGVDCATSRYALNSTVHGAGRTMSRTKAAGKFKKGVQVERGVINFDEVQAELRQHGIELRGAGADEAPGCYKDLKTVLDYHKETVDILEFLQPIGVAMAGKDVHDPFRD